MLLEYMLHWSVLALKNTADIQLCLKELSALLSDASLQ